MQDKLNETSNKLNATIAANKQQMEQDFTNNLQNELKDFQTTLMSSVENMITKKMEALNIAMQQSLQATVAQAIAQSLQNNNTMEIMPITQPDYNSQTSNTTNNQAQEYNTNKTNNTSIISPNNLKRKNSDAKMNNNTINININDHDTDTHTEPKNDIELITQESEPPKENITNMDLEVEPRKRKGRSTNKATDERTLITPTRLSRQAKSRSQEADLKKTQKIGQKTD